MTLEATFLTDRLAVGGAFPAHHVPLLAAAGLVAVVDLREEACDDASLLSSHGLSFLHLPTPDHAALTLADLARGVAFAREHTPRGGILVHCAHGIGRSATLGLCILVDQGLDPLAALRLAKDRRDRISPSPAQYHAFVDWLAQCRRGTGAAWEIPDFDAFAAVVYRPRRAGG